MPSDKEIEDYLQEYFSKIEWDRLSQLQKMCYFNVKRDYEVQLSSGSSPKVPDFMSAKKLLSSKQYRSKNSSAETSFSSIASEENDIFTASEENDSSTASEKNDSSTASEENDSSTASEENDSSTASEGNDSLNSRYETPIEGKDQLQMEERGGDFKTNAQRRILKMRSPRRVTKEVVNLPQVCLEITDLFTKFKIKNYLSGKKSDILETEATECIRKSPRKCVSEKRKMPEKLLELCKGNSPKKQFESGKENSPKKKLQCDKDKPPKRNLYRRKGKSSKKTSRIKSPRKVVESNKKVKQTLDQEEKSGKETEQVSGLKEKPPKKPESNRHSPKKNVGINEKLEAISGQESTKRREQTSCLKGISSKKPEASSEKSPRKDVEAKQKLKQVLNHKVSGERPGGEEREQTSGLKGKLLKQTVSNSEKSPKKSIGLNEKLEQVSGQEKLPEERTSENEMDQVLGQKELSGERSGEGKMSSGQEVSEEISVEGEMKQVPCQEQLFKEKSAEGEMEQLFVQGELLEDIYTEGEIIHISVQEEVVGEESSEAEMELVSVRELLLKGRSAQKEIVQTSVQEELLEEVFTEGEIIHISVREEVVGEESPEAEMEIVSVRELLLKGRSAQEENVQTSVQEELLEEVSTEGERGERLAIGEIEPVSAQTELSESISTEVKKEQVPGVKLKAPKRKPASYRNKTSKKKLASEKSKSLKSGTKSGQTKPGQISGQKESSEERTGEGEMVEQASCLKDKPMNMMQQSGGKSKLNKKQKEKLTVLQQQSGKSDKTKPGQISGQKESTEKRTGDGEIVEQVSCLKDKPVNMMQQSPGKRELNKKQKEKLTVLQQQSGKSDKTKPGLISGHKESSQERTGEGEMVEQVSCLKDKPVNVMQQNGGKRELNKKEKLTVLKQQSGKSDETKPGQISGHKESSQERTGEGEMVEQVSCLKDKPVNVMQQSDGKRELNKKEKEKLTVLQQQSGKSDKQKPGQISGQKESTEERTGESEIVEQVSCLKDKPENVTQQSPGKRELNKKQKEKLTVLQQQSGKSDKTKPGQISGQKESSEEGTGEGEMVEQVSCLKDKPVNVMQQSGGKRELNKKEKEKLTVLQQQPGNSKEISDDLSPTVPRKKTKQTKRTENTGLDNFLFCKECNQICQGPCHAHGPLKFVVNRQREETATLSLEDMRGECPLKHWLDATALRQELERRLKISGGGPITDRAFYTVPDGLCIRSSKIRGAGIGIWSDVPLEKGIIFGPYDGVLSNKEEAQQSGYSWELYKGGRPDQYIDGKHIALSNWLRFVNCASSEEEQNLIAFQFQGDIYYQTIKPVPERTELLIWYGDEYARELGINTEENTSQEENEFVPAPEAYNSVEGTSAFSTGEDVVSNEKYDKQNETDGKPYKCSSCSYFCYNVHNLHRHERIHAEYKPYKCAQCDKSFVQANYLKSHLHVHREGKLHACEICRKSFSRRGQLTAHRLVHLKKNSSGWKACKCGKCGKLFSTEDALLKHKQQQHFGEEEEHNAKHRCLSCPYTTNYITVLRRHEKTHLRSKTHRCSDCGEKFTQAAHLIRHKMSHRREQPHMCETCDKGFSRMSDLVKHRSTHPQDESHVCMFCGKIFAQAANLQLHLQNHAGPQPYKCGRCNIGFAEKSDLTKHQVGQHQMNQHSGKGFKCSKCHKIYPSAVSLKRHKKHSSGCGRKGTKQKIDIKQENPEEVNKKKVYRHSCSFCEEYKTDNIGNLRRHERKHTGDRPFKCETCGKAFAQKMHLQKHSRTHPKERTFSCEFCGKCFHVINNLARHRVIHLRDKGLVCKYCNKTFDEVAQVTFHISLKHGSLLPHKCHQCPSGFLQLTDLKDHVIKEHIQRKFPCTVRCGKAFSTKEALLEHKRREHFEKEKKHKCPTCSYATNLISDFRRHSRTHTGERPYKCNQCNKGFSQHKHMKNHLAQHTKNRLCQCDVCGKHFRSNSNLAMHKLTHSLLKKI